MRLAQWVAQLDQTDPLSGALTPPSISTEWRSVAPDARPALLAAQYLASPRKVLLVCSTHERALAWQAKLILCGVPEDSIRQLPSALGALFEDAMPESVALSDRIGALRFLIDKGVGFVITTPQAALERTLPLELLQRTFRSVKVGETVDPIELRDLLVRLGYEPADPVRVPGQFSQRGGILDIYAMGIEQPARLEFFDDKVESLRLFDPNSQRSVGKVDHLELAPSREVLYPPEADLPAFIDIIESTLRAEASQLGEIGAERLTSLVEGDMKALRSRAYFDRLELYRPLLHPDSECALDLVGAGGLVVLDDPFELEPIAARAEDDLQQALIARAERGEILKSSAHDFMLPPERMATREPWLAMTNLAELPDWLKSKESFEIEALSMEPYRGQAAQLVQGIKSWQEQAFRILVATDQPTRARAMLEQVDFFASDAQAETIGQPGLHILAGNMAGGFVHTPSKQVLITDQELFGVGRLKLPQRKFNEGLPITTVLDLKEGDYVVHINFGIGVFQGLTKRTVAGVEKEYLFIQYAVPDKLYVPADQLDRIQKYLNPSDAAPKLNRLTGGEWQRTVKKAREEAREFARDLTKLYAERKTVERPPFGPDSPWQGEMEATFPYVETASQLAAIQEVKRDLNNDFPMDRLVCGDVGFGKTEVAIRAAFKVAQAGKQVAVLCPTTILSEQHFRNFRERLGAFPLQLDLLNRFRTGAERKQTLEAIESGECNLVIGTHALLSQDIKFKDLGMVIIDEEQKFGVKQKEVLKKLRVSVDVMVLSATPIPRTLSMALMDLRQMSLITDPPPGRLPIRTFVRPFSREVVKEAILREMARGGQVYYVFNRVRGIHHVHEQLKKIVPNARIVVGHGQMSEQELEPVMIGFIKGEADVLLSTTIVESGLDIPNANTLIVEDADKMGLAQLYQLRGRVGRSDRQAYAYLLHSGGKELTEGALNRLQALQEFSTLGSGYNLAFRDLQIRGAGDLLGAKQHGTMASVGYDLFTQLIGEEIKFLKAHADGAGAGTAYRDPLEGIEPLPALDLPTKALIPESYIEDQGQRLYFYKIMMSSRTKEELGKIEGEIQDRYGRAPDEVKRAFWIMRLRLRAHQLKIEKVDGNGGRIAVTLKQSADINPRVWNLMSRQNRDCYFTRGQLIWPYTGGPVAACESMLNLLESTIQEVEEELATLDPR
ncbi:MAG: transcription-repair coupling factor [Chthonomonas sp.]|nr:transcription-repair coupling factor [Chthonomonas sp.]